MSLFFNRKVWENDFPYFVNKKYFQVKNVF